MTSRLSAEFTLRSLLVEQAGRGTGQPALLAPGRHPSSLGELCAQIDAVGAAFARAGLTSSDRVAVVLPDGPETATAVVATMGCAACAPLNPAYRADEFRFFLEDLGARAVLMRREESGPLRDVVRELGIMTLEVEVDAASPAGQFRIVEPAASSSSITAGAPRNAQATALILHTSGSTARPKIVPLSEANLLASALNISRHLELRTSDRCLSVMPLFHIHGIVGGLLSSLLSGASIVCTPGFDKQAFFDWIAEFGPSWYTAVPTIHQAVVDQAALYRRVAPGHRFRFIRSSSAALAPRLLEALQAMTAAPVIEAYGMTEAAHQMASNPLPPAVRKPGSVGRASGVEIALMDEQGLLLPSGATGEIVIRGASVTAGYESNPAANAQAFSDGWFRTGDQGRIDGDGYLFITGRLKEIVNRGGEKIAPREVDEALLEHPDVAQAVAFAAPHSTLGEDLLAAVVLRDGADRADTQARLRGFLFERLAAFKIPSAIVCVDALPRGATGKLQRRGLHERLGGLLRPAYVAPRSETERSLEAILREVLGSDEALGVHDNFFSRGGDSLRGAQAIARVNRQQNIDLPASALFAHPSVAELAGRVELARLAQRDMEHAVAAEIDRLSDEEVRALLAARPDGAAPEDR